MIPLPTLRFRAVCYILTGLLALGSLSACTAAGAPSSAARAAASSAVVSSAGSLPAAAASSAGGAQTAPPSALATMETVPEIEVTDWSVSDYSVTFGYRVGSLVGAAELIPLYMYRLNREPLTFLTFRFHVMQNAAWLETTWKTEQGGGQDRFRLDETRNLWVNIVEGVLLYPTGLTEEQAAEIFPGEELAQYCLTALLCYEPLYNVSIYQVWDDETSQEPDTLLEYYDVYEPDTPYLWQSDIMYPWHLTIEYTDGDGVTRWLAYYMPNTLNGYAAKLPLDGPDWREDV